MLRVQAYPVMDGVELYVAGVCSQGAPDHRYHRGTSVSRYISSEDIAKRGLEGALAYEMTILLHEYTEVTNMARC